MKPLAGWRLGGPTFTARDVDGRGRLGEPVWGPNELLRDLELRLGLPHVAGAPSARVPRWAARIKRVADDKAFYAKSFAVDALGTAQTLLAWRDALVDAGWDGAAVPNGGDRLDALVAIEHCDDDLPLGTADRASRIVRELQTTKSRIYDAVSLVEERSLWSRRWQQIFALLEEQGTRITQEATELPGAPADTDLGLIQRLIRGDVETPELPNTIRGDGSLLLLRGETPAELASLTVGVLAAHNESALVIRCIDNAPLETALVRHGLAGQGHTSDSAWRPAMQVLPLALELAYEPRDPYRVLELLTLPIGPFQGLVGSLLAKAVARQPGVGGQEWLRRKQRAMDILGESVARRERDGGRSEADAKSLADAYVAARLARVAEWLEAPGAGREGAPRATLLALAGRVRTWLQKRLAAADSPEVYAAAFAQAQAFTEALIHDPREVLTREDARQMLDTVVRTSHGHRLSVERAGRIPHVSHPSALLAPVGTVVFWGFVAGTEIRTPIPPWHRAERAALNAVGVAFPDISKLLAAETNAWRRGVLAARERVVFVLAGAVKGDAKSPHPLWHEICARLRLDTVAVARLTRHAQPLLQSGDEALAPIQALSALPLPAARHSWNVPVDAFADSEADKKTSATALELLASCPLSWVLARRAKLQAGSIARVASGPLLNGNLSHRLVEELHLEKAFECDEPTFDTRAAAALETLIEKEGATLRLAGAAFERAQLRTQILRAMRALRRYLTSSGYHIAGVEEDITTASGVGMLVGRLDVRLADADGQIAVLDLKWGASTYEARIKEGRAIQLAAYSRALRETGSGPMPPAGYFALSTGRVLTADERMKAPKTLDGPTLNETWSRVGRTTTEVVGALSRGEIHVAARRALPLLDRLGVKESDRERHFAAEPDEPCTYCPYPAICGRQWEELQ